MPVERRSFLPLLLSRTAKRLSASSSSCWMMSTSGRITDVKEIKEMKGREEGGGEEKREEEERKEEEREEEEEQRPLWSLA